MVEIEDLVVIARNRDKARVGLPPGTKDLTASVVYIVGTRTMFRNNPIVFDRPITDEPLVVFDFPTEQRIGVIDDKVVVTIKVPDLPDPLLRIDHVHDRTSQLLLVGGWFASSLINQLLVNRVAIEIQAIRLSRSKRILAAVETAPKARFRALVRTARIQRSLAKKTQRAIILGRKFRRPIRIIGRAGFRLALKAFLIVGLAIDILLISHATVKGAQRAGPAGAIGAGIGATADALTLGLLEEQTSDLGTNIEMGITRGAESSLFAGRTTSFGTGGFGAL